jgi:putative membrane protein
MRILLNWLLTAVAVLAAANLVPGVSVDNFGTALVVAIVLGLVNAFIKPIFTVLTLPLTAITLGLFLIVINAAMFGLTAWLVPGFHVNGFWAAVFGGIVVGLVSYLFGMLFDRNRA